MYRKATLFGGVLIAAERRGVLKKELPAPRSPSVAEQMAALRSELSGMKLGALMKKATDSGVDLGDADDKKAIIELLVAELVKKETPAVHLPPLLLASHVARLREEMGEEGEAEREDREREHRSLIDRFNGDDGPNAFSTSTSNGDQAEYFCRRLPDASGTPVTKPAPVVKPVGGLGQKGPKIHRRVLRDNIQAVDTEVLCRLAARAGIAKVDALTFEPLRHQTRCYLERLIRDAVTFTEHVRRRAVLAVDVCHAVEREGRTLVGLGLAAEVGLPNTVPPAHHMDWASAAANAANDGDDEREIETDAAVYASLTRPDDESELEEPDVTQTKDMMAETTFGWTPVIAQLPFERLIREFGQDFKTDLRFEPRAFKALYAAWETRMLQLLSAANAIASPGCLQPNHIRLMCRSY